MDTQIIRHLMRGDFTFLKPLVILVWIVMVLASLESLTVAPDDFDHDAWGVWSDPGGRLEDPNAFTFRPEPSWQHRISGAGKSLFAPVAGLLLLLLGSSGVRSSATRPIRGRERVVAKVGLLVLVVVIPQSTLIALTLAKTGLAWDIIASGLLHAAGVFVPLQLALLAFGALHQSPVRALGAALLLVASLSFGAVLLRKGPEFLLSPFTDFWGEAPGPFRWFYLGGCATGFALVLLSGGATRPRWCPLLACLLVLILSWMGSAALARRFAFPFERYAEGRTGLEILPERRLMLEPSRSDRRDSARQVSLTGTFTSAELPGGRQVSWFRGTKTRLQVGDHIAKAKTNEIQWNSVHLASIFPPGLDSLVSRALLDGLPPGTRLIRDSIDPKLSGFEMTGADLGVFDGSDIPSLAERVTLETELNGFVSHCETIADIPLHGDGPVNSTGILAKARILGERHGFPMLDVLVVAPSLGSTDDSGLGHWASPGRHRLYFLYSPRSGIVIAIKDVGVRKLPVLAGCEIHRYLFAVRDRHYDRMKPEDFDLTDARLLIVAPRFDGVIRQEVAFEGLALQSADHGIDDLVLTWNWDDHEPLGIEGIFADYPDPESATAAEVVGWIRRFHRYFEDQRELFSILVSEYASRHLDVLLDFLPIHGGIEEAILLGAREEDKDKIIARLVDHPSLVSVVEARGWMDAARPELLRFYRVSNAIALEEPSTFPRLLESIGNGKASLEDYEAIRLLPGLDPIALDESVREMFAKLAWGSAGLSDYDIPLRHGLKEALEVVWAAKPGDGITFDPTHCFIMPPEGVEKGGEREWVLRYKLEEFGWDKLARRWYVIADREEAGR